MRSAAARLATDAHGFLTGQGGERLNGFRLDERGERLRSVAEFLRAPEPELPAIVTTRIDYSANLPQTPALPEAFGAPAPAMIPGCDAAAFAARSLPGGSVAITDATGGWRKLSFRWARLGADEWALFYLVNRLAAFAETAWRKAGRYHIDPHGQSASPLDGAAIISAAPGAACITLSMPAPGVTSFRGASQLVEVRRITQNGRDGGRLVHVEALADGHVHAVYANGVTTRYAEIAPAPGAA